MTEFTTPTPRCGCPLCSNPPGTRMDSRMETVMTEETTVDAKDLDETRRLLYIALAYPRFGKPAELVGTIMNALAHHNLGVDPYLVLDHLDEIMHSSAVLDSEGKVLSEMWVKEQIEALTARLEAAPSDTP